MIYQRAITVAANTAKVSADRSTVRISKGLIWYLGVHFPPGCCGLAHIQLFDGKYQLFPSSPGESLASDGAVIGFDDLYYKAAAPFELQYLVWNNDDNYSHTLTVRVGVATNPAFMTRYLPGVDYTRISNILRGVQRDQEKEKEEQLIRLTKEITGR